MRQFKELAQTSRIAQLLSLKSRNFAEKILYRLAGFSIGSFLAAVIFQALALSMSKVLLPPIAIPLILAGGAVGTIVGNDFWRQRLKAKEESGDPSAVRYAARELEREEERLEIAHLHALGLPKEIINQYAERLVSIRLGISDMSRVPRSRPTQHGELESPPS